MKLVRYAIVALLVTGVLAVATATQLYPRIAGVTPVRIIGASMGETIPFGSLAYATPASQYREGDIVTYRDGANLVTHRLVHDADGLGTLWQTQGDANDTPDAIFIPNKVIVGRVDAYLPIVGHVASLLERWYVTAFLMLIAVALLWWPEQPLTSPPGPEHSERAHDEPAPHGTEASGGASPTPRAG